MKLIYLGIVVVLIGIGFYLVSSPRFSPDVEIIESNSWSCTCPEFGKILNEKNNCRIVNSAFLCSDSNCMVEVRAESSSALRIKIDSYIETRLAIEVYGVDYGCTWSFWPYLSDRCQKVIFSCATS